MAAPDIQQSPMEEPKDLGFGTVVGGQREKRLLNRDGTFNVARRGLPLLRSWSIYHAALTTTWTRFLAVFAVVYLVLNALFATGYLLCGPGELSGAAATDIVGHYAKAFFFSVHTLATIGYGNVSPIGM